MIAAFNLPFYAHIDNLCRIVANKQNTFERGIFRNIVFNFGRCFLKNATVYLLIGKTLDPERFAELALGVVVMTILVQFTLPNTAEGKSKTPARYLSLYYGASFGILWLEDLRNAE